MAKEEHHPLDTSRSPCIYRSFKAPVIPPKVRPTTLCHSSWQSRIVILVPLFVSPHEMWVSGSSSCLYDQLKPHLNPFSLWRHSWLLSKPNLEDLGMLPTAISSFSSGSPSILILLPHTWNDIKLNGLLGNIQLLFSSSWNISFPWPLRHSTRFPLMYLWTDYWYSQLSHCLFLMFTCWSSPVLSHGPSSSLCSLQTFTKPTLQ